MAEYDDAIASDAAAVTTAHDPKVPNTANAAILCTIPAARRRWKIAEAEPFLSPIEAVAVFDEPHRGRSIDFARRPAEREGARNQQSRHNMRNIRDR
jgi:hypothetical protein